MALIAYSGFDYDAPTSAQWTGNFGLIGRATNPVRTGSHSLDVGVSPLGKTFSAVATIIAGAAYYASATGVTIMRLIDGSSAQISLTIEADRSLGVRRGDTTGPLIAQSSPCKFPPSVWNYVEMKATIHDSTGSVEVRLNGAAVISATGLDTQSTGNAQTTEVRFWQAYVDDLYVVDTTGSAPYNTFLGDVRVRTLYPDGAGSSTQWTPLSSTNVSNIDETGTADDDTTYNSSSTPAQKDLFTFGNLPDVSGTVLAVQARWKARKDDGGTREARSVIKSAATTDNGPTEALGLTYVSYLGDVLTADPATSAAWAIAAVNAIEAGYELIT